MIINNVHDKFAQWTGPWEVKPVDYDAITAADIGRKVIYRESSAHAELGIVTSYRDLMVWARYHLGSTAMGASPANLFWALKPLSDGHPDNPYPDQAP